METDLYECEWTQGYQKYHFPHFFIIKGIENEKFIVCDSFFNKDNIQIDITQFVCKIIEIRYFVPDSEKMFNKLMVKEELLKDIYEYKNYGMSSEIICFADKLYNWEGIDKLTEQYSDGESMFPLADNIRIFMTNRLSYIEMIKKNGVRSDYSNHDFTPFFTHHKAEQKHILHKKITVVSGC